MSGSMDFAVRLLAYDMAAGGFDSFTRGLNGLAAQALIVASRMGDAGNGLAFFGAMTLGANDDLRLFVDGLEKAVTAGADLQMATTMASIAIKDGSQNINQIEDAIVQLANTSQYKIAEVDQAFRILGERGFDTAQIIGPNGLGQAAVTLGQALGVDAADGAQLLGQAFYIFKNQGLSTTQMIDSLTGAFYSNMNSVGDLTQFLGMAGGTADSLGVSFNQLLDFGDMLTPMFGSASSAGASLAYMLRNLAHPATKAMADEIKQLGLNVFDSKGNFVGLQSIMDQLFTKMQTMTEEQKIDVIGTLFNVRSGRAAMDLMTMTRSQFDSTYSDILTRLNQTGQAQKDASAINETATGAWKRLTTTVNDFFAKTGTELLPFLVKLDDGLNNLLAKAQQNPLITKFFAAFLVGGAALSAVALVVGGLVVAFTLFGAIIGPVGLVMLGIIATAGTLAAAFTVLTSKGQLFHGALAFLNPVIDAGRAAFAALWADISKQNWGPLLTVFKAIGIALLAIAGVIVAVMVAPLIALGAAILGVIDLAGRFSSWIGNIMGELHQLGTVFGDVGQLMHDVFTGQWGRIAADTEKIGKDWNAAMKAIAAQQASDMKKQAEQEAVDAKKAALEKTAAEYDATAKGDEDLRKQAQQQADFYTMEAKNTKDKKLKAQLEQNAAMAQAQADGYRNEENQAKNAAANLRGQAKDLQNDLTNIQQTTTQQVGGSFVQMSSKEVTEAKGARGKVAAEMQEMKQDAIIQASQMESGVVNQWTLLGNDAYTWGQHAGNNFAFGLLQAKSSVSTAAQELAAQAAATLEHSKPKEGPLKDDDVWGLHLAQNFAQGMLKGASTVKDAARALAGQISLPTTAAPFQTSLIQQLQNGALGRQIGAQQVVIQNVLDGKVIGESVLDLASGKLKHAGTGRMGR